MENDVSGSRSRLFSSARSILTGVGGFGALIAILAVGSGYSQADSAAQKAAGPAASSNGQASASSQPEQLAAKLAELDAILAEKHQLEDSLRIEKSAQGAAALQSTNTQKLIRLEIEDFFAQSSNRARLDNLFEEYKRSSDEEDAARKRVESVQRDLAAKQLKFSQAARDVERVKAQLASETRKRDSKKIQSIARRLDRNIYFNQPISFRCSTTKSLSQCLAGYQHDGRMSQWVQEHYERVLGEEIRDQVETLRLNPNWYAYRVQSEFSEASMSLDGTVDAQVSVQAAVTAKKMMPCAILDVPYDLCESQTHSLIVRSNKHNDQVLINNQPHGSTPVSLILDSGTYEVQVVSGGVTQKRTLALENDRVLRFNF